jgi:hypothetical protein
LDAHADLLKYEAPSHRKECRTASTKWLRPCGSPGDGDSARAMALEVAVVLIDAIDRRSRVGQSQSGSNLAEGVRNMEHTETPREPSAMSRSTAIAYAIGLPLSLLG